MIRINLDMDMPKECHECPFQLRFKDGEADTWYMRRCVIVQRKIEYPRPEWCPLEIEGPCLPKDQEAKQGKWIPVTNGRGGMECNICHDYAPTFSDGWERLTLYCPNCGTKMKGVKWK